MDIFKKFNIVYQTVSVKQIWSSVRVLMIQLLKFGILPSAKKKLH